MNEKIIQKDVTFDLNFTFPLFGYRKALAVLENDYNVEQIEKYWSIKNPFSIKIKARLNIKHDINITKMRIKQHELMMDDLKMEE